MKGKFILIVVAGFLIFIKIKNFAKIQNIWIVSIIILYLILTFISIHRKNKEINTPRPVYLVNN